jgi:hypothetical protein
MSTQDRAEADIDKRPAWRYSYTASSPGGTVVASIDQAFEHSMGNPTVGTVRVSNGLELSNCNPAFIWSDDSRYLVVPRWCRRFGLFRRQRLAVIDVVARITYVSPFTYWLMQPERFVGGRLDVLVSDWRGISWPWRAEPLVLSLPSALSQFAKLK